MIAEKKEAYPLFWPEDWPRTHPRDQRGMSSWKRNANQYREALALELGRMQAPSFVISCNIPLTHCNAKVKDMWETPGYADKRGLDGEADLTFEEMCRIKGRPPSRKAQFCTTILKLAPQRRWIRETFGPGGSFEGQEFCRYTGVRREESNSRKDTPVERWDDWFDCQLIAPLVDWTKQMCFDYVKAHGEAINPLYTMGFGRVGCAPCINSSKADILNWHARRPEMIDKVRGLEERTGRTFFFPVDRDGVSNGIDEVLRWAGTSRGGSQMRLTVLNEREGCESKYGLCE